MVKNENKNKNEKIWKDSRRIGRFVSRCYGRCAVVEGEEKGRMGEERGHWTYFETWEILSKGHGYGHWYGNAYVQAPSLSQSVEHDYFAALPPASSIDTDEWMTVTEGEMEGIMKEREGTGKGKGKGGVDGILEGLETFFGGESGIGGVEPKQKSRRDTSVPIGRTKGRGTGCDVTLNADNIMEILSAHDPTGSKGDPDKDPDPAEPEDDQDPAIKRAMEAMDNELDESRDKLGRMHCGADDVEVNAHVVENLLESFASQNGGSGPVGNFFNNV